MAEAFLASIAAVVLEKLAPLIVNGVSSVWSVKDDLEKLEGRVKLIQAVLSDAERRQHQNEPLRLCMWKLGDILYDTEDVIDDFKCEDLRRQVSRNPDSRFRDRLSAQRFHGTFSIEMSRKIKGINQRLGELKSEWDSFGLRVCSNENRHVFHQETQSFINSSDVIGRHEEKMKIIDLLMRPGDPVIIPIVGMAGLGKTTLAQFVYNDPQVTSHFQKKIWVCVSKEFDLPRLLKRMIHSINPEQRCDHSSLDALQNCLRGLLQDKRFLLVLDDVWNHNQERWTVFRNILSSTDGRFESKIIVTTRSLMVASKMSSIPPIELKGLTDEDCLILFKKRAFDDGDEQPNPNLMRIGEDIVRRCKGVPLAVTTFGNILRQKTDESEWTNVRDGETWTPGQNDQDILPVLKLSYYHLPPRLQRCLALLSLYKKEEIFRSHEVIQLWMANGLLEHPKGREEWEDVGGRYLNELLSWCLIKKEKDYDRYFAFRIHDLFHDLALEVSQKDCKTVSSEATIDKTVRYLSFSDDKLKEIPTGLKKLKGVRTVIIQEVSKESNTIDKSLLDLCVSKFKHLRVLRLCSQSSLTALHKDIGELKHLRDLDLTGCHRINKLPSSFRQLRCLQKLKMSGIPLEQLPDGMNCLIELRYLEITVKAKHLTEIGEGSWLCLQYLGLIDCDSLECLPEGLKHLTSLRRLDLLGCSNLTSLPRTMKFLTNLQGLSISSCKRINLQMKPGEEDDNLQLSLKTLSLWDLGELRDLPQLLLEKSSSTLRRIRIENCNNFEALPVWLVRLSSLQEFEILDCSKMPKLPAGMDWLGQIRHLPFLL